MTRIAVEDPGGLVASLACARVLCVGDVMVDHFIDGAVARISPESPVPVFQAGVSEDAPGGAANVACNIAALGAACTLVSVVGADAAAADLAASLSSRHGVGPNFVIDAGRPTTRKIRYVAQGQHLLRVDYEMGADIAPDIEDSLIEAVSVQLADHDVLVLSDYAKGVLTARVVRAVIDRATEAGRPVLVDPKTRFLERFAGATVVTPNAREAHLATGIDLIDDNQAAAAGARFQDLSGCRAVLVTRSEKGMTLVQEGGPTAHFPTVGREVFDVVGAGDTVIATLAAVMAAGAPLETAAFVSNVAAGIVVGKRGTATVSPGELIEGLEYAAGHRRSPILDKCLSFEEAVRVADHLRGQGKRIGFTNGVFDLIHPGHVSLLTEARRRCDALIVGVNSDDSVRRLKGPTRPINPEQDRVAVLAAFAPVDAVVVFGTDTPLELITAIRPDVLIKGGDYTVETVVGADVVQGYGGEVLLIDLIAGKSSSSMIEKARNGAEPGVQAQGANRP